jgi:hypothetical protein
MTQKKKPWTFKNDDYTLEGLQKSLYHPFSKTPKNDSKNVSHMDHTIDEMLF